MGTGSNSAASDVELLTSSRNIQTPGKFEDVPEVYPALDTGASCDPLIKEAVRGVAGGFANWTKGIPPCIWVLNETDKEIVVRVSKKKPSRLWTKVDIEGSISGARIGGEATLVHMPDLQDHIAPMKVQRFPFWSWRETEVSVAVEYDGSVFIYRFESGNLGIFKDPHAGVMRLWSWYDKEMDVRHPALARITGPNP